MTYRVIVLNPRSIGAIDPEKFRDQLLQANFYTLAAQYGLDKSMIEGCVSNLEVSTVDPLVAPFFVIKYQGGGQSPLLVYRWTQSDQIGKDIWRDVLPKDVPPHVRHYITDTSEILVIELDRAQLKDMGILLAYEVARWAAIRGSGVVMGLDGKWYRMNRHQAFIPVEEP